MYYIVVYDVEEKGVNKVCKLLRRYLHWVQNSVFEGELSEGKFAELRFKLLQIIEPEVDSVIIYTLRDKWRGREVIGLNKNPVDNLI
ncbi:CRISPR-associated endonuclease Cas2 [Candidatus Kryptobacter tengchongensis]|uniref:CRISPR-associated endonuclease Cas2 n=1 Tax=Kryptobacter tengchongensis TaxID=1643429 RepID=UPI0007082794|nr:CRISPR-associated endonuclease Cas2 [Candidatus Kryptobacter tengchongensis]CUS88485.1 CRISPR-associated protein Cas2 [Candidatus Kryptobacter tengchongensis]